MSANAPRDLLQDLWATLNVRARIAFRGLACERWGIGGQTQGRLAFHVVLRGRSWARVPGVDEPLLLEPGAVLLYRPSCRHLLADSPEATRLLPPRRIEALSAPVGEAHVGLLCGYFEGVGMSSPLIDALPPCLVWRNRECLPPTLRALVQALECCALDTSAGSERVLALLCELLLHLVVREPAVLPRERVATSRMYGDPALRRALDAIHSRPDRRWTVDDLAHRAGLSRSTFAQRFAQAAGVPPMTYLRRYRLGLAERQLHDGGGSARQVARAIGYSGPRALRRARRRVSQQTE